MKILLIRHGDPDYEIDSLTEKGWREAEYLSERLAKENITDIYVSVCGRAKDTARPTLEKLGKEATVCEWLHEFDRALIQRPDAKGRRTVAWDWLPKDWTADERLYQKDEWYRNELFSDSDVKREYDRVIEEFDKVLEVHGYKRENGYYRAEQNNHDTLVFFCHLGVMGVLLSHLLHVSPMITWQGTYVAPASVTTLITEERREGIAAFRLNGMGDISHLYANDEEPAFAGRYRECYSSQGQRYVGPGKEMRKSVWSGYFYKESPEDMVLLFEKAGYHYSELALEHATMLIERDDDLEKTGKEFRKFSEEHGMHFLQGHLPFSLKICQNRDDFELMKKYLDLFHAVGVKYCVIHCDKFIDVPNMTLEMIRDKNIEALQELGEYIKETNMVICLENLNIFPIHAEDILEMLEKLDEKHFGICFDTGHLFMNKGDVLEFVRTAGKKIKALHIADNEGVTDQHLMPFGKGRIKFMPLFKELREVGYDGLYNLEIPGETSAPLEIKLLKLEYISKMLDVVDDLTE